MGGLSKLVVCNFKSYGGRHEIGPFKRFSCVIGPNGSGKSNLMDAVSFVLLVRTDQLRGSQLRDLVFRAGNSQELDDSLETYVEMHLANKEGDGEVAFRRSIHGSQCRYQVDGRTVRQKDYLASLESVAGVMVRNKNFLVFQGDVDKIAAMDPTHLSTLLQQISGAADMAKQYDELAKKRDDAEHVLDQRMERRNTMQKEKRLMQMQKKEAEQFESLQLRRRELLRDLFLFQLYHMEQDRKQAQQLIDQHRRSLDELLQEHGDADRQAKQAAKQVRAALVKMQRVQKQVTTKQELSDDAQKEAVRRREKHKAMQRSTRKAEQAAQQAAHNVERITKIVESTQADISQLQQQLSAKEQEMQRKLSQEAGQALSEEQLREYRRLDAEARRTCAEQVRQVDAAQQKLESAESERNRTRVRVEALKQRQAKLTQEAEAAEAEAESSQQDVRGHQRARQLLSQRLAELDDKSGNLRNEIANNKRKIESVVAQLSRMESDERESARDRKRAQLLSDLKRLFNGVHGRVSELVTPIRREFALPVAVALGRDMESIIVDSAQVAMQAVEYLKQHRLGVETFVPLDSIRVKPVKEGLRQLHASAQLVRDVLQYDDRFDKAVRHAVGNTLLVDTLETARRVCFAEGDRRIKVVTMAGELIAKSGNMSGGGQRSFARRARQWEDRDVQARRTERDELARQLQRQDAALRECESEAARLRSDLSSSVAEITQSERRGLEATERAKAARVSLRRVEAELLEAEPALAETQRALDSVRQTTLVPAQTALQQAREGVFADFCRDAGLDSIAAFDAVQSGVRDTWRQQSAELTAHMAGLESKLRFDSETLERARKEAERLQQQAQQASLQSERVRRDADQAEAQVQEQQEAREELMQQVEQARQEHEQHKQALKQQRKEAKQVLTRIETQERAVATAEQQLDNLVQQRADVLDRARIAQIRLPRRKKRARASRNSRQHKHTKRRRRPASDDDNDSNQEEEQHEQDSDFEHHSDKDSDKEDSDKEDSDKEDSDKEEEEDEEDDDDRPFDFAKLDRALRTVGRSEFDSVRARFASDAAACDAELEKMSPNLRAKEKFNEIDQRLREFGKEWAAARDARDAALGAFEALREKRKQRYLAAFRHVRKHISHIYKMLTWRQDNPFGGEAWLHLADEQDNADEPWKHGVLFNAQPPGKRFSDIEALSGGERTVAALALLFALHSFEQSPFFVLDEVDAALDAENVDRVANYIRARARHDGLQSIVISLKDMFFEKADALVGVCKDRSTHSSRVLTADMTRFDAPVLQEAGAGRISTQTVVATPTQVDHTQVDTSQHVDELED